jgi:hypothetical protein
MWYVTAEPHLCQCAVRRGSRLGWDRVVVSTLYWSVFVRTSLLPTSCRHLTLDTSPHGLPCGRRVLGCLVLLPAYKYVFFIQIIHGRDFDLFWVPLVGSCSWRQGAYMTFLDS